MIVYVVQDSMFGDYGNGAIFGVFIDKTAAEVCQIEHGKNHTDLHECELDDVPV